MVRLDLKPEIEAHLAAQARARGVPLDVYLQAMIEDLAREEGTPAGGLPEFRAMLDALAEMGRNLPPLPASALSRESVSPDRG